MRPTTIFSQDPPDCCPGEPGRPGWAGSWPPFRRAALPGGDRPGRSRPRPRPGIRQRPGHTGRGRASGDPADGSGGPRADPGRPAGQRQHVHQRPGHRGGPDRAAAGLHDRVRRCERQRGLPVSVQQRPRGRRFRGHLEDLPPPAHAVGRAGRSLTVPSGDAPGDQMVTSFSSKSELALNLSTDGSYVTFMGYHAPIDGIDVSNSNTPGVIDPTNPVYAPTTGWWPSSARTGSSTPPRPTPTAVTTGARRS